MIASVITSVVGMAVLIVAWLGVQVAWRRQAGLACGNDPLDGRLGCHGCHCDSAGRQAKNDTNGGDGVAGEEASCSGAWGGSGSGDSVSLEQR